LRDDELADSSKFGEWSEPKAFQTTPNRGDALRGDIHTNTIENVWNLLKRSVAGSYHKISEKHIDRYLDELEWRFNNRSNPYLFRDTLMKLLGSGNLEYRELVAA